MFVFQLGLVCFRLKGTDELNQKLLSNINASGKIHMVPASVNEKYVIRFCAVAQNATDEHIGMFHIPFAPFAFVNEKYVIGFYAVAQNCTDEHIGMFHILFAPLKDFSSLHRIHSRRTILICNQINDPNWQRTYLNKRCSLGMGNSITCQNKLS